MNLLRRFESNEGSTSKALLAAVTQALCHLGAGTNPECANKLRLGGAIVALADGPLGWGEKEPIVAMWAAGALGHVAAAGPTCRHALATHDSGSAVQTLVALVALAAQVLPGTEADKHSFHPSDHHRRAAARAGDALASLMGGSEPAEIVADAVYAASREDRPWMGNAVKASSVRFAQNLRHHAKKRLQRALTAREPGSFKAALDFARVVRLSEKTIGEAKCKFKSAIGLADDRRRYPWNYEQGEGRQGTASSWHSSTAPSSPRAPSPRPYSPRSPGTRPGASCRSPASATSPSSPARWASAQRATSGAVSPRTTGGSRAVELPPPSSPLLLSPSASPLARAPRWSSESNLGVAHRSASPVCAAGAVRQVPSMLSHEAHVRAAETAMEVHLRAAKDTMAEAMARMAVDHDDAMSRVVGENVSLQQALADSRAREREARRRTAY